jgi:F-type H+-transporting ATPase subunit b
MAATATTTTSIPPAAEHNSFPPFDKTNFAGQIFWLAITFAILYLFLSRWALPRMAGTIEARRSRLTGDLKAAEDMKKAAEDAGAAYETALAEARRGAQAIAQEARDKLTAEADETRRKLEGELAAKLAAAEAQIASTKAQAMSNVEGIAMDTAGAIVRRLLGQDAQPSELNEAVKSALGATRP